MGTSSQKMDRNEVTTHRNRLSSLHSPSSAVPFQPKWSQASAMAKNSVARESFSSPVALRRTATNNLSPIPTSASIRSCPSPRKLGNMIRVLTGRPDSTELLQLARERLRCLQTVRLQTVPPAPPRRQRIQQDCASPSIREAETRQSPTKFFVESEINLSRISMNNSALESVDGSKGSLNLSLSPSSALHGVKFVEMPFSTAQREGDNELLPPVDSVLMGRLGTIDENFGSYDDSNIVASSSAKKRPSLSTSNDSDSMHVPILQNDNESDVARVDKVVTHAERTVLDLKITEGRREDPTDATRRQVLRSPKIQATPHKTEQSWRRKVDQLNKRLEEVSEQARLVISAERQLRRQVELEGKLQAKRNDDLTKILLQTNKQLNEVQTSYDVFERKLIQATGLDKEKVAKRTKEEVHQEILRCIKKNSAAETTLHSVIVKCKRAEEDKRALSRQVHHMSEEVQSGKLLIDKLLKTTNDSTKAFEWEKKEKEYISAIRNIQRQIRAQASVVSLDLYKSCVDENKAVKQNLQKAEKRIACLESKLENKANRMSRVASATPNTKPLPLVGTMPDVSTKNCLSPTIDYDDGHLPESSEQKQCNSSPRGGKWHQEQKTKSHKRNDDLTGMTIHCQISPGNLAKTFQDSTQLTNAGSAKTKQSQFQASRFNENQLQNKENNNVRQTPASLTMQKARKFGGRKGLQLRLNKIRSPPPVKARALRLS